MPSDEEKKSAIQNKVFEMEGLGAAYTIIFWTHMCVHPSLLGTARLKPSCTFCLEPPRLSTPTYSMDYHSRPHFYPPGVGVAPALVPASFQDSDDEDPSPHVPFDIHQYFGLSPGTPICLDSLQDPSEGEKPQYTYATLVKLAIWSSPQRKLTLSGIYEALENRFSWFRIPDHQSAWKVSTFRTYGSAAFHFIS